MNLGPYVVKGELGRGGAGVVFRCAGPSGVDVAVKLLSRASSPAQRARFDRERRLLASLSEADGFVPLLDVGESPQGPYLVMPLVAGGNLRARLRRGPLPIDEAVALAEALAAALARAHDLGIVHRDLKPENVLFTERGRPLLADLGLAKHWSDDTPGASRSVGLSRTGELAGTAGYMPPEQMRDAKTAGPAADVFAFGAVIYECLAGWPAYEGNTFVELVRKVEDETAAPIGNARPETPPWLAGIVERALARAPEARFADGATLLRAVRSRDPGRSTAPRGRRRLVLAATFLGLSLVVAAAALVASGRAAPPPKALGMPMPSPSASGSLLERLRSTARVTSRDFPAREVLAATTTARRDLIARALRDGVVYSIEDALALRKSEPPTSRVAAALHGLAEIGSGRPDLRAEGTELLRREQGVSEARELADLVAAVDRFSTAVMSAGVGEAATVDLGAKLEGELPALRGSSGLLGRWPVAAVDPAFEPLARLTHLLWTQNEGWTPALNPLPPHFLPKLRDALGRLESAGPFLARAQLYAAYRYDPGASGPEVAASLSLLEALSLRCLEDDTPFAADGLYHAWHDRIQLGVNHLSGEPPDADPYLTAAAKAERVAKTCAPACRDAVELVRVRLVRDGMWARIDEGREGRESDLLAGVNAAAAVYAARTPGERGGWDAIDLFRFLLEADRASDVGADLVASCTDELLQHRDIVEALLAELLRVRGDPRGALRALGDAKERYGPEEVSAYPRDAVRALCLADLGELERARQTVQRMRYARGSFLLTRFKPAALGRSIDARAR